MAYDTDTLGTLTERFAALWSDLTWTDVSEADIAGIKDHVLDTLACALTGAHGGSWQCYPRTLHS
ncbi:hypothetical protein ACFQI9_42270 [Paraburkholderia dipogonis]|uniref:hypothetical protein n=1 Tax=Paraburkholderia dipogonis TaxID=1211383 RepID=UPI003622D271